MDRVPTLRITPLADLRTRPRSYDVVVIGCGLAGAATAYYLAGRGAAVVLVEREGIGSQASGHNAGGINPLHGGVDGPLGRLAMDSFRLHRALWGPLQDESGVDLRARPVSRIELALSADRVTRLQRSADRYQGAEGFSAQWLSVEELCRLEPRVARHVHGGLHTRGNFSLDSARLNIALVQAAQRRCATIVADAAVGLTTSGDRVTGVQLAGGRLSCSDIVFATGPWSQEAQEWLRFPVPVEPLRGQMLRAVLPRGPLAHDVSAGIDALYGRGDEGTWIGGTEERCGFDRRPTAAARRTLIEGAARLLPEAADARVLDQFAALRPVTKDGLPIVGKVPGWSNAYLATGAGRKGVLFSTGIGHAVADLICDGATRISVAACDPLRFGEARHREARS
jgi:glycine oxidase